MDRYAISAKMRWPHTALGELVPRAHGHDRTFRRERHSTPSNTIDTQMRQFADPDCPETPILRIHRSNDANCGTFPVHADE